MGSELEQLLHCPVTRQSLREVSQEDINQLNERIRRHELVYANGEHAKQEATGGLITADGALLYLIYDGIVAILPNLAILLSSDAARTIQYDGFRTEKKIVQDFYDQFGWQKTSEGLYRDTDAFVDTRTVIAEYHSRCHLRVNRYLKQTGGDYLLDVASGPLAHPEYLSYSKNFQKRICVDLSLLALQEAKAKLGDNGIYLLADVTRLPLHDDTIDSVISLHTIYHVPKDEQQVAINELYRVAKPDSPVIVVYSWGQHSLESTLYRFARLALSLFWAPCRILKRIFRRLMEKDAPTCDLSNTPHNSVETEQPGLYFHAHNYRFFKKTKWNFSIGILVWESVGPVFTQNCLNHNYLGRRFLRLIYRLEDWFPRLFGRLGQYPLLVINKQGP